MSRKETARTKQIAPKDLPSETKARAQAFRDDGLALDAIAWRLGISRYAVSCITHPTKARAMFPEKAHGKPVKFKRGRKARVFKGNLAGTVVTLMEQTSALCEMKYYRTATGQWVYAKWVGKV